MSNHIFFSKTIIIEFIQLKGFRVQGQGLGTAGGVHNATAAATAPTAPDSNTDHKSSSHQLHLMGPKKKKILQVGQKHFSHVDMYT